MSFRAAGAFALHLLIVLASLIEAAGLDVHCLRQDQPEPTAGDAAAALSLRPEEDDPCSSGCCPCCQTGNQRLAPTQPIVEWPLLTAEWLAQSPEADHRVRRLHGRQSDRGPPLG